VNVYGKGEPGAPDAETIPFIYHDDVRQRVIDLDTFQNSIDRKDPWTLSVSILRRLATMTRLGD
jgi:hypothetical protein